VSALTLLHLHGKDIFWDAWTALPVHAVNWHDRLTAPTLAGASRRFAGGLAAGSASRRRCHTARRRRRRRGARCDPPDGWPRLILTPGCVLPLAVPDENLAAASARSARPRRDPPRSRSRSQEHQLAAPRLLR